MSRVFVISDLHIGHKKIMQFAGDYRHGETPEENVEHIFSAWNARVRKRDTVYVLGDICMDINLMPKIGELNGTKIMIRGNHDIYPTEEYLKVFKEVHGLFKYRSKTFKAWFSHCPIHPQELRGLINVHGHVHQNHVLDENGIPDTRYFNACVENTDGAPIPVEWIRDGGRHGRIQWRELLHDYRDCDFKTKLLNDLQANSDNFKKQFLGNFNNEKRI